MRTRSPVDVPEVGKSGPAPLVVLVGATAVGKTALAIRLAEAVQGEIVSADSRQVYRRMNVGTAKPTAEDRRRVPHHLLDILDPDQTLSLAIYQQLALEAIAEITRRERVPILVGGTGQYVMAVVEGWQVPHVPPDAGLRRRLYEDALHNGPDHLHARLRERDPEAAAGIDPRNIRRVVRALEVCEVTGRRMSEQKTKVPPPYRTLLVGLALPREELYRRIDERIDTMMSNGLEQEVRTLVASGYGFDLPAMSGVGYGQFALYLRGEATMADVVLAIRRATRRFVRHQSNWFRPEESRIHWFAASPDPLGQVEALVRGFLLVGG
jgi:tRNA dimethylallyltransferase